MTELIQLIVDNGIGVICVAYMIYFQNTTMKEMNQTLSTMSTNISLMNERLKNLEEREGVN